MMVNVRSRSDLSAGAVLMISFPEEKLDKKALYTLEKDWPEFLIPFRYRVIDGQIECSYQLGDRIKFQYRYGKKTKNECITMWKQTLQPLLECDDWFLKPFSFVLDERYLYLDKTGKHLCYLYVPSLDDCCDFEDLKKLAVKLADQNRVAEHDLEIKILRSIMQDFHPKGFLKMLQEDEEAASRMKPMEELPVKQDEHPVKPIMQPQQEHVEKPITKPSSKAAAPTPVRMEGAEDEIVIQLDADGKAKDKKNGKKEKKEKKEKSGGLFGGKKEKKEKVVPAKEKGKLSGLFGGKKSEAKEIMLPADMTMAEVQPSKPVYAPVYTEKEEDADVTMLDSEMQGTFLRLVGDPVFPKSIPVTVDAGKAFTIGRFDVTVGEKQSSFEFDKKAKAISRHHAAIERTEEGYWLIDQSSKAGTFLNNQKLTPGVAYLLEKGARVSFGTAGADYIWED